MDDPEHTAVVPGGGIDPGETIEDAAVREVREETGLGVRLVRELGMLEQPGRREPQLLHETHFVQAVPTRPTDDQWEHLVAGGGVESGLVRCYWMPVLAGMTVWGTNRGALLERLIRKRVVAYVTRERDGRTELLIFDHRDEPDAPTQVPAGRIDGHESLEEGLRREVEEETGVTRIQLVAELADPRKFERLFGPGAHESHAFHAVAGAGGPDVWEHHVTGTGMDAGFVFLCRWVPLDDCPPLWGEADPFVGELRRSITKP